MPASKPHYKKSAEYRGVPLWRIVVEKTNAKADLLIPLWLPDGRRDGHKYWARNPTRADKKIGSFCVVISGPRQGTWRDFATGEAGGNLVALFCYINGGVHTDKNHFTKAAKMLADFLKIEWQ